MAQKRKRPSKATQSNLKQDKKQHSHPVISQYYKQTVTLRQFLLQQIPLSSKSRRRRISSLGVRDTNDRLASSVKDIANLLDQTLIGVLKESSPTVDQERRRDYAAFSQSQSNSQSIYTDTGPTCPQSEIVDFVISALVNRTGSSYQKPRHLLAHGFQRAVGPYTTARVHGPLASNIPGIVAQYPNHNAWALKQAPWTDVLDLLGNNGEDIMVRLLFDCGVFGAVGHRGMFYQISGVPLSMLEALDKPPEEGHKAPAVSDQPEKTGKVLHKPNSILFFRRRMLYARPTLNARGNVQFGLKHMHVLNRFPSDSLSQTVHVMKYIFPRQFGLHNVFTSKTDIRETVMPFKDYTFREEEINRSKEVHKRQPDQVKIPKRLRGRAVELVQKLQNSNTRISYVELLRYYCPESGPPKFDPPPQSDSDLNDPKSSEPLVTQLRIHPSNDAPQPSLKTAESPPKAPGPKLSLTDYATPSSSVSAFCRAVLRKLIPLQFFGDGENGKANQTIVFRHVDRFIRMRRFETLSLHQVCKGLKITGISWLEPPTHQKGAKLSLSDLQKRTELLHELVYYIFDSILVPLILTNFYVTESQTHRNRLFYFRHDVWRRLTEQPLLELKSSMLEELKPDKAKRMLDRRTLGYSALRLLPKAIGIRPILNLRRRTLMKNKWSGNRFLGASINSAITPIYNMLNYEKTRKPHVFGSALQHVGEIYTRVKEFKERLGSIDGLPPLYFVKLDIQSCFDTIPQPKLIRLIEELVSEEAYNITKHVEMRPQGELNSIWPMPGSRQSRPLRKYVGRAAPGMKPQHLPEVIGGTSRRNTVFVDTLGHKEYSTEDLLDLLDEHVRNNLVRIGKKYFRQRNGIPQGSVLSSLLCNFFYAELERKVLGFLQSDNVLLLRLVDDFLLISSNADLARQFLQVMLQGQPEYGITVNPAKSLVNFSVSVDGIQIPRLLGSSLFPYCGNLIDTCTLELFKDNERLLEGGDSTAAALSNALTVESTRVPGRSLHRKMLAAFKLQMHPMYFDLKHNSPTAVLSNLYTNFVTSAMKMYRYMKSLQGRAHPAPSVVIRTITDLIHLAQRLLQTQRPKPSDATTEPTTISQNQVQYLATAAFRFVLNRKQTRYASELRWLEGMWKAARPKSDKKAVRMLQVVRGGNAVFEGWRF